MEKELTKVRTALANSLIRSKFSTLRAEHLYAAPWNVYAFAFSWRPDQRLRFALGSYLYRRSNAIQLVKFNRDLKEFVPSLVIPHDYAPTKLLWVPDRNGVLPDLLASSGEYLRVWKINSDTNNCSLTTEFKNIPNPLTSFDWNLLNPATIVTSSIDTTCAIWDLEKCVMKASVKVGRREVFDAAFGNDEWHFMTSGLDASLRYFDTRDLTCSKIIIENDSRMPYTQIAWNQRNSLQFATAELGSGSIIVMDLRYPSRHFYDIVGHKGCVNAVKWAPTSCNELVSGGEDKRVMIWEMSGVKRKKSKNVKKAKIEYLEGEEVLALQWPSVAPECVGVLMMNKVEIIELPHKFLR